MNINMYTKKDIFLDKIYNRSMKELNMFYELNWTHHKPILAVVKDRKTIDMIRGKKTESWLVGWINPNTRMVYVLDRNNFEKESSHTYRSESYARLIKHELSHCFQDVISKGTNGSNWLWEGLALYTSGQNTEKKKPVKFKDFLGFYNKSGRGIYAESGFAVGLLVEKFGKKKLLELIRKLPKDSPKSRFKNLFKKIYGFKPTYIEFNRIWLESL